jgi:hypothetical protein
VGVIALAAAGACSRAARTEGTSESPAAPLAGYAALRLIVAPTSHVRATDSLGWVPLLGGARGAARRMDTALVAVFAARGTTSRWVFPAELARAFDRNRTYATDPYQLVVEGLRRSAFKTGEKYGEPLSSQLRTMIALQEDTRYVVLPVDLYFERAGAGQRAVLRVALLDPRTAEARFVADLKSDGVANPSAALSGVAGRLADLFVAP